MIIVSELPAIEPGAIEGLERDPLVLTAEERRWVRQRRQTRGGREIGLALPTGARLHPGTILAIQAPWYVEIEAAKEKVLALEPRNGNEAIRVAFEVGNRHFPVAIDGRRLLVPDDPAMEQLALRLEVRWERTLAIFEPVGIGHGHAH